MSDPYEFKLNGEYHLFDRYVHYKDNVLHRDNGPAVIYLKDSRINYNDEWWYKGKQIHCSTQEEFNRIIKLLVFS